MNSPGLLFYLNVPDYLHRNGMPDMFVIIEANFKEGNVTNLRFLGLDSLDVQKVKDFDELYMIACNRAQELWDRESINATSITASPSIMKRMFDDLNSCFPSAATKEN